MHWMMNGVDNRLPVHAAACCCDVGGRRLCPGFVHLVAFLYAWAAGPSCWVRLGFCRLGGCVSRFCGARGQGVVGGGWGASFGWGCPVSPRPCGDGLVLPGSTFRSQFVQAGRRWRGAWGCVCFFRRPRWDCGGHRPVAHVVKWGGAVVLVWWAGVVVLYGCECVSFLFVA